MNVHGLQYETYQMSAWIKWIKLDNGLYSLAFSLSKTTVFVTCIKWFCALNCGTLITVSIDNDLPFWINFRFFFYSFHGENVFISLSSLYLTTTCSSLFFCCACFFSIIILIIQLYNNGDEWKKATLNL